MAKGLLIDTTKCIGCGLCEEACKEANGLSGDVEKKLTATTWTFVEDFSSDDNELYVRHLCMHCEKPTCVSVCPVAALEKTPEGPVIYHPDRCMGCRYCMVACPFAVPKYQWLSTTPKIQKCIMCYERVKNGGLTACAEACPTGATLFGDRDELVQEAHNRIQAAPGTYVNHLYGEKEVGGTDVIFLAGVDFGKIGFRTDIGNDPLPLLTWYVLKKIPSIVSVGGVMLFGLWWIINRRMALERMRLEERRQQLTSETENNKRNPEHVEEGVGQ